MPPTRDIERHLRSLHREAVREYEEELKRSRADAKKWAKWQRQRETRLRAHWGEAREGQADTKLLCQFHEENQASLKEFLRDVRPGLVKRPPHRHDPSHGLTLYDSLQVPGLSIGKLGAATLLAPTHDDLKGNRGKRGNPWLAPSDPSLVRLKRMSTGRYSGCEAQPVLPRTSAVFWFSFNPFKSGNWNLLAFLGLHGFYIVKTDLDAHITDLLGGLLTPRGFLSYSIASLACIGSKVSVDATVDVYQHGWHGARHFDLLSFYSKDAVVTKTYDRTAQFDYQTWLVANDLTLVKVEVSIDAVARGSGYYSEINFSDGQAHFIQPLLVMAWG